MPYIYIYTAHACSDDLGLIRRERAVRIRGTGRRRAAAAQTVVDGGRRRRWRRWWTAAPETVVDGGGDEEGLSARRTNGGGEDEGLCSTKTKKLFRTPTAYIGADPLAPVHGWNRC